MCHKNKEPYKITVDLSLLYQWELLVSGEENYSHHSYIESCVLGTSSIEDTSEELMVHGTFRYTDSQLQCPADYEFIMHRVAGDVTQYSIVLELQVPDPVYSISDDTDGNKVIARGLAGHVIDISNVYYSDTNKVFRNLFGLSYPSLYDYAFTCYFMNELNMNKLEVDSDGNATVTSIGTLSSLSPQ